MYKKNTFEGIWKWEKHNVLYFIQANELTEFTIEEFCKKVTGVKYHIYSYNDRVISNLLLELVRENKIKVSYISQGSKTVAIYSRKS